MTFHEAEPIEDPPRFSADVIVAGSELTDRFRNQPTEVRRGLIQPLVDTLVTTEVRAAKLSADEAEELARAMEANLLEVRDYATQQRATERITITEFRQPAEDY